MAAWSGSGSSSQAVLQGALGSPPSSPQPHTAQARAPSPLHLHTPHRARSSQLRQGPRTGAGGLPLYLRIWLYLAKRSDRQGAPVFIWKGKRQVTYACWGHSIFVSISGRKEGIKGHRGPHLLHPTPCPGPVSRKLRSEKSQAAPYLPSAKSHHQISNEGIFGLPGAMRHHDAPAVGLGQLAPRSQETTQKAVTVGPHLPGTAAPSGPPDTGPHHPWQETRRAVRATTELSAPGDNNHLHLPLHSQSPEDLLSL